MLQMEPMRMSSKSEARMLQLRTGVSASETDPEAAGGLPSKRDDQASNQEIRQARRETKAALLKLATAQRRHRSAQSARPNNLFDSIDPRVTTRRARNRAMPQEKGLS